MTDDVKGTFITFDSQRCPKTPRLTQGLFQAALWSKGWLKHRTCNSSCVCRTSCGSQGGNGGRLASLISASLRTEGRQLLRFWESRIVIHPFFVCHVSAPSKMCIWTQITFALGLSQAKMIYIQSVGVLCKNAHTATTCLTSAPHDAQDALRCCTFYYPWA